MRSLASLTHIRWKDATTVQDVIVFMTTQAFGVTCDTSEPSIGIHIYIFKLVFNSKIKLEIIANSLNELSQCYQSIDQQSENCPKRESNPEPLE